MSEQNCVNSSLYTRFVSQCFFPLHERLKKHSTVAIKQAMEQQQWWSLQAIQTLQLQRLKQLLQSAKQHVPYYQQLLQSLDVERDIRSLADLSKIPFLTKPLIREHLDALKADNAQGLSRFNTGGSSGQPLIFYIGKDRVSHDVAAKWRATRWWDVDIGDKEIVLWGSPIELGAQDRVRQIRDYVLRTQLLPAFEMSDAKIEDFIRQIKAVKPKMLFGYPSAFALIAKYAQKHQIQLNQQGIKVAFVTSEKLYDEQRQLIEQTFGCPVANGYGGRDAGFLAHQCPSGGMHITADDVIIEIVDSEGHVLPAGQSGEIVVTHLSTSSFPFIRYKTGDVGVLDDQMCACGRGLPLLKEIQGRTTDFIIAKDGTVMHGLALIYIIRDLSGIEAFKIEQLSLDLTRVYLQPDELFDAACIPDIEAGFKARLGQGVNIDVQVVDSIPKEQSGKFRYVVSRITG